jgi:hypothetical protein
MVPIYSVKFTLSIALKCQFTISLVGVLAFGCIICPVSTSHPNPSVNIDSGVILGSVDCAPKPRRGERAALIKYLYDRFPNMPKVAIARRVEETTGAPCGQDHVAHVISRYVSSVSAEELTDFQANKAAIYDAVQHKALASITDEHLAKASALQLVTAAAILEDKSRLVRGQPTSLHVHMLVDVLDAMAARQERDE